MDTLAGISLSLSLSMKASAKSTVLINGFGANRLILGNTSEFLSYTSKLSHTTRDS